MQPLLPMERIQINSFRRWLDKTETAILPRSRRMQRRVIEEYLKTCGDVNGDGSLSVSDVTAMVNYVLGISVDNFDISVSDLDGNNEISVADIMQLVTMILDGITPSSFTITIDGESSGLNIR